MAGWLLLAQVMKNKQMQIHLIPQTITCRTAIPAKNKDLELSLTRALSQRAMPALHSLRTSTTPPSSLTTTVQYLEMSTIMQIA